MATEFERTNKVCSKCGRILIQGGIHMGIPFGHWRDTEGGTRLLVCAKCYDEATINLDHKTAKIDLFKKETSE